MLFLTAVVMEVRGRKLQNSGALMSGSIAWQQHAPAMDSIFVSHGHLQ